MRRFAGLAALTGFAFAAAHAWAAAPWNGPAGVVIAEQGTGRVPACVSCHGSTLLGSPALKTPAIAGRPAAFIVGRLDHYAGPTGHNPAMKLVASNLTEAQRRAVAAYLSSLSSRATP